MTEKKYYVGMIQSNNTYIYVSGLDTNGVRVTTSRESSISFDELSKAQDFQSVVKDKDNNKRNFLIYEVDTTTYEIDLSEN